MLGKKNYIEIDGKKYVLVLYIKLVALLSYF